MRKYLLLAMLATSVLAPITTVSAEETHGEKSIDVNEIKFPREKWDPVLVKSINRNPVLFDKNATFGVEPPPSNDSEVTRKELDTLLEYAATHRDYETVEKIFYEHRLKTLYQVMLATSDIDPLMMPAAFHAFDVLDYDLHYILIRDKKIYSRPRPEQLEPKLERVIKTPGHAAYPSGHATQFMVMAYIMGDIDPENAEHYQEYAKSVALRREIAGVHYPSDSAAGQLLAKNFYEQVKTKPEFIKALEEAKQMYKTGKEALAQFK